MSKLLLVLTGAAVLGLGGFAVWWPPADAAGAVWTVDRGTLVATLVEPGTLRAARSASYRSPVAGREAEIDPPRAGGRAGGAPATCSCAATLERGTAEAVDAVHEAELALQVAELELLEATAGLESTVDGEGSLTVEEARTNLALAERRVDRLRREVRNLEPLLDRGFITGDELARSRDGLETAEADLAIAGRRASVLAEQTHPVATRRAELQLARSARSGRRWSGGWRRRAAGWRSWAPSSTAARSRRTAPAWWSTSSSWPRRRAARSGSATG